MSGLYLGLKRHLDTGYFSNSNDILSFSLYLHDLTVICQPDRLPFVMDCPIGVYLVLQMFRFYDRYICLFLEFIICTECITHLLMGEVKWITSSIPLWQDVMVGRHILDRLQSRLEQALQRLPLDLDYLEFICMSEMTDDVTLCSHGLPTGGKLNGVCAMWLGYSVPRF